MDLDNKVVVSQVGLDLLSSTRSGVTIWNINLNEWDQRAFEYFPFYAGKEKTKEFLFIWFIMIIN